jgi:hypothetical protein
LIGSRASTERPWTNEEVASTAFLYAPALFPESLAVLFRIQEPIDHDPVVARLVHGLNPFEVENVRVAAQVAEVLHNYECFRVEFHVHFRAWEMTVSRSFRF